MKRTAPGRGAAVRLRQGGMSLLEVLIAGAIILVVAIGILPVLQRALANNTRGWEATEATNHLKSELDTFLQFEWDHASLTMAPGETEKTFVNSWDLGDPDQVGDDNENWFSGDPADGGYVGDGNVRWTKTTRIRQYQITDLDDDSNGDGLADDLDGDGDIFDRPLDGKPENESFIHLKEIRVRLRGKRLAGPLGAGQVLTVRVLKAI